MAKIAAQILTRAIDKSPALSEGSSSNKPITSKWYQDHSGQYHTGDHFGLVRKMKYFGTDQYQCTISSLPLYIYMYINYWT